MGRQVPFQDCDFDAFLKREDLWTGLPDSVVQLCRDHSWHQLFELSKRGGH